MFTNKGNQRFFVTLISQQTPSNSSSFVIIPLPEAKQIPIKANNGTESPNRNLKTYSIYQ